MKPAKAIMPNTDNPAALNTSDTEMDSSPEPMSFPIVGIGASAGGLESFTRLLQHLPSDTGMAFVFVQHLAPRHASMLASLLSRATAMPVMEAEQSTSVKANHVYVIPPNTLITLAGGVLELQPRPEERGAPRPIDHFFRSLGTERKTLAIGVVLSGADSDGALGLQAIREEGGIAIVQSETSAKHPDMPRAAMVAGPVDLILSPEEIAGELKRIGRHPSLTKYGLAMDVPEGLGDEPRLNKIFALLQAATAVDFRGYKRGTIQRRLARRMILQKQDQLDSYLSYLGSNRQELLALYEDILINVTGFFRDPEVYLAFQEEVVPGLLKGRSDSSPLRVWVPGCSTGEEVYSIAMCLLESMSKFSTPVPLQIFGTDISERAIATARAAVYPESEVAKLSPERVANFFSRAEHGYQINKSIREMCVFARQNVCEDPPFSRLHLVSCRNVLIYFGSALQRQVVATFHYALQPDGYLMLGHAESLREFPDLFSSLDKHNKLYKKKAARSHVSLELIGRGFASEQPRTLAQPAEAARARPSEMELGKAAERIVLSEYAPAWVMVNENLEIIHSHGDTSAYLRLSPGRPALGLLKMARESIRSELRKLLARVKSQDGPAKSDILRIEDGGKIRATRLEARRIAASTNQGACFLVLFFTQPKDRTAEASRSSGRPSKTHSAELELLEQELALSSQRLQSIIDERDAANQDLTSANEEIQSSNEELQSINEELETSKEELQSTNEELNTVNEELRNRNQELSCLSNDLTNLLSSAATPILMLDNELRIRRVTTAAEQLLSIRPGDVGRPLSDIRLRLSVDDLEPAVRRVLETLAPREMELQDREGRWHVLSIRPYRTADNRIEGAVLVLVDIDQARRAQMAANLAREFAESVVESVQSPLLVLGPDLQVRVANRAFLGSYGAQLADLQNRPLYEVNGNQWNQAKLRSALDRVQTGESTFEELEIEQDIAGAGRRTVLINARLVKPEGDHQILVVVQDVTAHRFAERILLEEQARLKRSVHESGAALLQNREELRALTARLLQSQGDERRHVSRELHDDVSQRMAKLQFDVERLEQKLPADSKEVKRRLLTIRDEIATLSNDIRRIAYELHPSTLDHLGLAVALRSFAREFAHREGVQVRFTARKVPAKIMPEVASTLYRVSQEALRNVAKHAGNTRVTVTLAGRKKEIYLSIRDDGPGFDVKARHGSGGLGLISMQERVRLVKGKFSLKTRPGDGVLIAIHVPIGGKEEYDSAAFVARR
jgi:two-component system CheB/CheR fusion protein